MQKRGVLANHCRLTGPFNLCDDVGAVDATMEATMAAMSPSWDPFTAVTADQVCMIVESSRL